MFTPLPYVICVAVAVVIAVISVVVIARRKSPKETLTFGEDGSVNGEGIMWQLPRDSVPELEEILKYAEKSFIIDESLDFRDKFDESDVRSYLQKASMAYPDGVARNYHILFEKAKKPHAPEHGDWYIIGGVLTYKQVIDKNSEYRKFVDSFGVRGSGYFYYPPGGYREWHTNFDDKPGWRFYYISCPEDHKSWFNYINPDTQGMTTIPDKNGYWNVFNLKTVDPLNPLWHSIYSDTHRFSLGLHVPDEMALKILKRVHPTAGEAASS